MKVHLLSLFLFLLVASTNTLVGKDKLFPGFIITLNNDTLHGYIDYKNWDFNPNHVLFKSSKDGNYISYSPGSIREFKTAGEVYISAKVKVELSPNKTNDLTLSPNFLYRTDTVFLRAIILGEKELLYFKDITGKESFYIFQDSEYVWLMYKKYLKEDNGVKFLAVNNKYVGQLILYLQNCKSINPMLSKTSYSAKSLKKAFDYYYNCSGNKIEYEEKKQKVKLNFSVMAGATITTLKFRGENSAPKYFTEVEYPMSTNFTGGVSLDVVIPRNFGRWSFNNELILASYSTSGSYTAVTHENRYIIYESNFAFTYLKINTMFRGNFPVGKITIFGNIGFSNGFAMLSINELKTTNVFYDNIKISNKAAIEDLRAHEQSLLLGFGGKIGKIAAELRYETGNGFTTSNILWSSTNRFYLLASYTF